MALPWETSPYLSLESETRFHHLSLHDLPWLHMGYLRQTTYGYINQVMTRILRRTKGLLASILYDKSFSLYAPQTTDLEWANLTGH